MNANEQNRLDAKVVVKKVIRADRERVFDAWTNPEVMAHWYIGAPEGRAEATVDLKVGGKFTNDMHIQGKSTCLPDQSAAVKCYPHHGEYLEIKRPERLVFSWNSLAVQNSVVTVELRAVDNGTEVTITHALPSIEQCAGHEQGWTHALTNLDTLLSN